MNRIIKFRCWIPVGKLMEYNPLNGLGLPINNFFQNYGEGIVWMQFTGLLDKNGKEIYEGDIVRWDDGSRGKYWRIAQVKYIPGFWRFEIIPGKSINCFKNNGTGHFDGGSFMYAPDTKAHANVMEVMGNIYENPELVSP